MDQIAALDTLPSPSAPAPALKSAADEMKATLLGTPDPLTPTANAYTPIFKYAEQGVMDADPTGELTEEYGRRTGQPFNRSTVLELQVGGRPVSADELRKIEGGETLIDMAITKRQNPRRDFGEALATGPATDFIPLVSGLSAIGTDIKDMSKARDAMKKFYDQGPDSLSLQEKVWMTLFQENADRQAKQTWGGLVGTILRQMPAYGAGFSLIGAGMKGAEKAAGLAVKETAESAIKKTAEKMVKADVKRILTERTTDAMATGAKSIDTAVLQKIAQSAAGTVAQGSSAINVAELETGLMKVAQLQVDALANPKRFQGYVDFATEFAKRGFMDHGEDMFRGAAPGIKAKLREAAGVAFIEAPIKGGLYNLVDFAAVKPLVARAMGGTEAVTQTELQFSAAEDPAIRNNAKWLAFGSSWVEYASEMSGRSFNALFGIVEDVAKKPARAVAHGALAAVQDTPVGVAFKNGGYVRRLLAEDVGLETIAETRAAISSKRLEAAKQFVMTDAGKALNMTAEQIATDSKLADRAVKAVMQANSDKAFFGFWLADKLSSKGWGPDTAGKFLRMAGYDEILGEFMEERYSGFAQGLFGLDSQSDPKEKSVLMDRLSRAAAGMFPATWGQATAELVSFAVPSATRAVINRAYGSIGAGHINSALDLTHGVLAFNMARGLAETDINGVSESGGNIIPVFTEVRKTQTAEEDKIEQSLGKVKADAALLPSLRKLVDNGVAVAMASGKHVSDQPGIGSRIARAALGMVDLAVTGNPGMLFNDPAEALMHERLGNSGKMLVSQLSSSYQSLFNMEFNRRVKADAATLEPGKKAANVLSSTDIESIDKAIRPALEAQTAKVIKDFLLKRGTMIVDKSDVDALVTGLRAENNGDLPGEWKGKEPEFRKALREKLVDTAKNNMSMHTENGQASFSVEKKEVGGLAAYVDRLIAPTGLNSYFNVYESASARVVDDMSSSPVDMATYALAASVKDPEHATQAEYQAIMAIINQTEISPDFTVRDGTSKANKNAVATARRITGVYKHLLSPTFRRERGGAMQNMRAVFNQETGEYSLGWLGTDKFKSETDLRTAAAAAGIVSAGRTEIVFTPFNNFFSEHAAAFAGLFHEYFQGDAHKDNPFLKRANEADGFAKAKAEDAKLRADAAAGDTGAQEILAGYDAAAEAVLKSHGVSMAPSPADPSKRGWLVASGALNNESGTRIYLPMKVFSAQVSLVEDAVESVDKRSPGVCRMVDVVSGDNVYRPAIRPFIAGVQRLLVAKEAELQKVRPADRSATDENLLAQIHSLIGIYDPKRYNGEAVSKAVAGITLYYADNAVAGIGRVQTEGALYRGLGLIAREARALPTYAGFVSTVSRMFGAPLIDNSNPMAASMTDLLPSQFLDGEDKALPTGTPVNSVAHVRNMQNALNAESRIADAFLKSKDVVAFFESHGEHLDAITPGTGDRFTAEDRIAIAADVRSLMNGGEAVSIVRPAAVAVNPAAKQEQAEPEEVDEAGKPSGGIVIGKAVEPTPNPDGKGAASLLQAISNPNTAKHMAAAAILLRSRPDVMARLGLKADRQIKMPGDDNYLKDAFSFYRTMYPGLPANAFDMFSKAFGEAPAADSSSAIDAPAEDSEASQVYDQEADGTEVSVDASEEAADATNEDTGDDATAHPDYRANGIRESFAESFDVLFAKTLMQTVGNPYRGDSLAGHILDIYAAGLNEDGTVEKDGIADLLSGDLGNKHPAFKEDTFRPWISAQYEQADRKTRAFLTVLETLGFERSLRFLTNARAVAVGGAVRLGNGQVSVMKRSAVADARDTVAEEMSSTLSDRNVRSAAIPKAVGVLTGIKAAHAAAKAANALVMLPPVTSMGARIAAVRARMLELVPAFDALFGEDNLLSMAFRDTSTHVNVARHALSGRHTAAADEWLVSSKGFPGFVVQRLSAAVEEFKLHEDVAEGSKAAVEKLFGDRVAVKDPSLRGAVNMMLNLAAGSNPLERVRTIDGRATVALSMPRMSVLMKALVNSPEFEQVARSYYGLADEGAYNAAPAGIKNASDRAVQRMRRFGILPDGSPLFANDVGLRGSKGAKQGRPHPMAAKRELANAFSNPKGDGTTAVRLYSGDGNENSATYVVIPMQARSALIAADGTYDDLHAKVVEVSTLARLQAKRIKGFNNVAPALITGERTRVMHLVTADPLASKESKEADLGKTAVIGQVVDAARAYAGDKVSTGKWHIISDNEFYKSSTELLDAGAGKVQGLPDARKFIYTSLEDEWAASGAHQALFVGGDSLKVSVINNKTDGVLEGASLKPVPLVDWLRKNPGATQDTVVTWSGLGQVKLSDVIPGIKIEWVKPAGRAAGKLLKLSYDAELEFRVVANIDHGSDLVNNPMPKNLLREQANFPDGVSLTRAEYLALADVLDRKFRDAHPKTGQVNIRDWQVKALLDAGVLSHFSELVSKLTAATEVKRMITTKPTTYGVSAANAGQYVRMGADGMTVEAPYGAGDPLASGELRIPQAIADEYFDGITVDPALIRANADGGRPSFFIDTTGKAFVGHEYDHEFIADEVTSRFIKLDGLRKVGDRSAYIRYLSTEIMPLLLDIDTEQPVESGRVYLFDDLFLDTKSWSGGKVFDRLALKYDSETRGNRAVGDKTRVVLGGSAFMMERTPSDPSSKICARLLGFVTPNAQSTSLFATMETNAAGKSKWSLRTQRNTDVEHAGAVVIDTPDAPVVTGHDYDGDKALLRFRDMFRAGLESSFEDPSELDEMMTSTEPGIVNYVTQVTSANAKEAAKSMNEIRRMVNNSVWSAEWTDARYRRFPANVRHGQVEDKDKVTLAAPFRFATTANPLSDEARGKLDAKFTPASYKFTDATQSAAASAEGYLTSQIRGVAVHATAIIKNLFGLYRAEVGLVNNGGAVISNVDGTPFMDNGNVMFKAAYGAIDQEGWEQTLHFQSMWTNALFDALKGDGFALRYGITMELATIHYFLMTAAQPRSQEEYDKFALAWADWANGPIGKAITAHAAATADEDYDGYAGADPVKSMKFDDRANLEMTLSNYGEQRYDALDHGDQSTVLAAAAAYVASGASYDEAASRTAGLVDLFTVIEAGRSMMRITETGYANLSTVRAVEKLGKNVKVAGDILSGDSLVSVNDPRARDLLLTRRDLAAKVVVDSYGVFRGTYEGSPLREYIAAKFGSNSGEATPSSRRFSLRPAVRESAMRAVYAIAITRMTPADVGAKLLEATPSDRGNRTTAFMRTVERMYRSMFAKYADDSSLAFSNRALNQLIVPRVDEGNNDIPSIMLGGDADSTLDEVTKGLDALRDWPATDTRLDFVENGVAFTPREMWHALRMYAAFVAMPTAAARRGSSSFIALFGNATMRELTDHQIVLTSDSDELAGVFELGFVIPSKWGEGRPKSVLRMDNVIPDIFPAAEKATASGAMPEMFTVKGKLGQDVKVYRDEAAGWMAQSGPEAVPITDAQAKAYFAKAASAPKVTASLLQFGGNVKKVNERAAEIAGESVRARPSERTFAPPRRDVPVAMPRPVRPAPDAAPVDAVHAPVAVATPAAVNVWYGSGENKALSNLALRPFTFEGRRYSSVEQAYQSLKSGEFHQATYDAYVGKPGGVKVRGPAAKTDGQYNLNLMKRLMLTSFQSNKAAAEALLATGTKPITHTQDKGVWRTEFPRLLSEVRAELAGAPLSTKPAPVVNTVVNTGAIGRHVYLQDGSSFELNDGQYAANKAIVDMADGKYNEFVLSGPAGTGKTSVIAKSVSDIRQVNPGAEVVVASFTNTVARLIPGAMTIHKLLGMRRSQNIESFHADDLQFDGPSKKNNIPENGLIIIDEASMVGTELMQYIREAARDAGARILWAGDARQVAPINHKGPPPVFMADLPGAELTEVMRTSATNPLMKLFSRLRSDQGTTNPGSQFSGETDVAGGSLMGYIAAKTYDDFMDAAVIAFRAATVNSPEGAAAVRIVAGTVNGPGAAVPAANKYIRDQLFPDNRGDFIVKGELLMGQAMIAADEGYAVENGMPYVVEAVGPMETSDRGIQVYPVSLKPMAGEDRTVLTRKILAPEGYVRFAEVFQKLNKDLWVAKKYGNREGVKAANAAYDRFIAGHLPREMVPNMGTDKKPHPIHPVIQNGYAQTVHKAQGSTVRDVFVMAQSISRFGFSHVDVTDAAAVAAQRDNNNRMLYTAATRAQQRVYALLADSAPKTGYGAARVARSVMWTDAATNAAGENLDAAKAVAAINMLSRTAMTATSYLPAFLREDVRVPLTENQTRAAGLTSAMLNDIRNAHGVKGTMADGILEAASRVSLVTGFDTAIVSGAFMASAAAIGLSGDKSDGAKAVAMLFANRAGVGDARVLDFLKSKAQADFSTSKFTPAEFLFRYSVAFAGITGDIKLGEVVGKLVEKTSASLTQADQYTVDSVARYPGAPLNPKVIPLVKELNSRGIKTTLSGDFYGMNAVYVDFGIGYGANHDDADVEKALATTRLPFHWKVIRHDMVASDAFMAQRAEEATTSPRATKTRLIRLGGAVSPNEAISVADAVENAFKSAGVSTASLVQQGEFDFDVPKGPKAQKLSEMSLGDMRYHRNRALEDVKAYGPAVEGPTSLEHDDPKWAFAVKKLQKANASLARLNPYIAGVIRKTPSQAGFFTDTTANLTQEDRAAAAAAAQKVIADRDAAYAGADDVLALGQRQLPEQMVNADGSPAMGPADREQAARMSRSAVGFTPDRGGQADDAAAEYVKRIRDVLDQYEWSKRPDPLTEAEKREARGGNKRKEASPDTYAESAVGIMKSMMTENAGAGMREYSNYIRLALSSIRDDGNPQASRIADILEKALFRDVNGNPAPLQWYSAPGNADRMLDLIKQSGNVQSRVLYVMMREEDAETDPVRKANLARSRAMASKALAIARIWVNASREPEMESQRVAIEAQAAGHPAADLTDAAKAALEYYTRLQPAVMSELDPETMAPDAWNRFHVLFADTDVFFSGAVMPFFRGGDVRSILLNKQALAAIPEAFKTGNFLTMLLAAGNDKGTILKLKKIKGAMWKADGKGGYEDVPEAQRAMQTRFQRGTIVRDAVNDSFTQEEFATARFMLDAAHAYLGDGGASAKLPISGSPSFRDMSGAGDVDLSYKAALQRVHGIKADANGNIQRPWSLDILLTNAHNNLTEALYQKVEDTVKEAYKRFRDATGKVAEREMKALEWMEQAGYANIRTHTGARGETHLVSTAMTIPVKAIEEVFNASTAKVKLLANGRESADMTLSAMAELARQSFRNITANAGANMSWLLSDSIAPLHDIGRDSPFFQGTGYHSYWSKVMNRAPLPEYTARMRERFDNLRGMAESCFDDKTGEAFSVREADFRSARMLKFYADLFLRQGDPLRDDPAGLTAALASKSSPHYLGANATMWTMATKIYAECARRIHETAMADGTVEDLVLGDVPLAVFNAAIDSVSASRDLGTGRQGMTWSEIYKADGALPRNLGIDEALTQYAQGTATAVRYRMALNQAMLAADENGMPLIYAEPGTDATETIPDRMWAMTARWWAEVHGEAYDNTKSGRENAAELYKKIVPGKQTESGKQESNLGVRRYIFKQVKLPAKCSVFARVSAAADRMDDDTKGTLTAWAGGEAASVMAQILAVPGYGHPGAALAGVNRTLSWSKSLSVMCSLFFPIATAFESPVAAVGFWPTVFGLTKGGSDAARRMTAGQGMVASAAKKAGLEAGAPFMADIMKLIGSDDPALVELKVHAILAGLTLSDRSRNMTDHDRTVIAQDIKRLTSLVTNQFNYKTGKFVKSLLEGAMEESSELAFEYVINATKLAVFAQMNNKLRNRAVAQGRWWDPIRSMKEWAPYINAEVGGIDPAIYPWATPAVQQIMKTLLFSWEWTLGAWEAGGGNVLTQKFFGMTSSPASRNFMFGRWFRMVTGVMIGIPVGMQVLMTAIGKASGGDDDTKDDKWFNWQNEQDRKVKDFDITPMLRAIGKVPHLVDLKRAYPIAMSLVPALTGDEGDMVSSRKRRYYAHMGKQGWEVLGWFQDPMKSLLGKMSMPVQRTMEGVFGINPSMGWEKEWKDLGFWERWLTTNPEDSAALGMVGAFVPFSFAGMARSPEAGFINTIMPVGKGISKTRAEKEMTAMFKEWGDDKTYAGLLKARPEAYNDLRGMAGSWLYALKLNGYDPDRILKDAVAAARKPLYEKIHAALPYAPGVKPDMAALEEAANGLNRLEFTQQSLIASIKLRDKGQNIQRVGDLRATSSEALKQAFSPKKFQLTGSTRDAELGGDVRGFLATDEVPATMLGYKVMKTEELSPEDLQYFKDTPDAAGHFDMNQRGTK